MLYSRPHMLHYSLTCFLRLLVFAYASFRLQKEIHFPRSPKKVKKVPSASAKAKKNEDYRIWTLLTLVTLQPHRIGTTYRWPFGIPVWELESNMLPLIDTLVCIFITRRWESVTYLHQALGFVHKKTCFNIWRTLIQMGMWWPEGRRWLVGFDSGGKEGCV